MKKALSVFLIIATFAACTKSYIPKPRGYFRISFPEKSYRELKIKLQYTFEIADYNIVEVDSTGAMKGTWINIITPANKADLHLTYARLNNDLTNHIEESRKLAYDHSVKADAIEEQLFINEKEKVYGTVYYIEGNAASPIQFYLTDSSSHFLRGALYIREIPNIDSISPVIDFLKSDIIHLIETTKWNE